MGIFKKVKGAFFYGEEEEEESEVVVEEPKIPTPDTQQRATPITTFAQPAVPSVHIAFTPTTATPSSTVVSINQNLYNELTENITKSLKGKNYLLFFNALAKLRNKLPREQDQYETALSLVDGASAEQLLLEGKECFTILNQEEQKFKNWFPQNVAAKVTAKETELQRCEEAMQERYTKIQNAQLEIEQLTKQKLALNQELSTNRMEVATTEETFAKTLDAVRQTTQDILNRIQQYLVTPPKTN